MTSRSEPRLRFFEKLSGQRHITGDDRYIYRQEEPRYRANIIGTGTIGQEHMRVASLLGRIAVNGLFDENSESAKIAVENFAQYSDNELVQHKNLAAACDDPNADVLFICTPNYSHIDVFEIAAKTGKPIFLEKPMATRLDDARRIVEIANDYPSFVQVGLQYRYKAPYVEARHEVLARKSLGAVKTINMSEYRPPFLDKVEQWNKFAKYSGGTLIEKCCHYFDLLNLFAEANPIKIYATGSQAVNYKQFSKDGEGADIDDQNFVIVEYENGVTANFTLNMFSPWFYEEMVVCGDKGRLVATETFDFHRDLSARATIAVEMGEQGVSREANVGYAEPIEQSGHHGATFFEHVALADRLDGKEADAATPLQGLWSIIVAAAAQQSISTGLPVIVDDFIEANDLNTVLDR